MTVTLQVEFSDDAHQELLDFSRRSNRPVQEIIAHALRLEKWWWESTRVKGYHILMERDGKARELLNV